MCIDKNIEIVRKVLGNGLAVESYAEGRVTKTGKVYNNTYCHVYQVRGKAYTT